MPLRRASISLTLSVSVDAAHWYTTIDMASEIGKANSIARFLNATVAMNRTSPRD
jgi:hypothetical protein